MCLTRIRCIVKDCENYSDQGLFVGALCSPCYTYITTNKGKYSQAYRNAINTKEQPMVSKVTAYCAEDGRLFNTHEACKEHETKLRFKAAIKNIQWDTSDAEYNKEGRFAYIPVNELDGFVLSNINNFRKLFGA